MTAAFRLWSKSTKVSDGQRCWRSCSRVTICAGVLKKQEQNARRLFAQLDDGAIATQFSTGGVQFEDTEAPGPWRVDRHAHEHNSAGWRNSTPFPIAGVQQNSNWRLIRQAMSIRFKGPEPNDQMMTE